QREQQVLGKVHAVSPSLDPETRTFEVIAHTEGDNPRLQDGEFVAVWIARPPEDEVLSVPLEALRYRNDQSFVLVLNEDTGRVSERRVGRGQEDGADRAVTEALEQGERVVTDGRAALNAGHPVRVLATSGAEPGPSLISTGPGMAQRCQCRPRRCAARTRSLASSSCSRC